MRQAKEITIPSGGMEGINSKVQKLWENFELAGKLIEQENKLLCNCKNFELIQNTSYTMLVFCKP